MAVLMVYDRDNTHDDPVKDATGCYKRGYIVQVFADTQALVIPPAEPFLFIKATGAPVDDYETWAIDPELSDTPDAEGHYPVARRRAYMVDLDSLPAEAKTALAANRVWEVV